MGNGAHFNINKKDKDDVEKEMFVEGLKRQVHSQHTPEVADELCRMLDEAKKGADTLEQLFNMVQPRIS